jgi:hypothetical protein
MSEERMAGMDGSLAEVPVEVGRVRRTSSERAEEERAAHGAARSGMSELADVGRVSTALTLEGVNSVQEPK